jgi:pimeloyl-ACP methyl ester carboxylesterase
VHGALGDGREWAGNYAKVLPEQGYPVCEVTVPGRDEGDLQVAVEYVVYAIRAVHARAGRPIDVIAHSAGALLSTDALKYWPDLAADVHHFVGLAGVYGNGTDSTVALCAVACPVAAR